MTDEEDKLEKIDDKLDSIQRDVNDMQGDVRIQTTMLKETSKSNLKNRIRNVFGSSDRKRQIWYVVKDFMSIEEIIDETDFPQGTVTRYTREMAESGVLDRRKNGNERYYRRNEITEGIGMEQEVEEDIGL